MTWLSCVLIGLGVFVLVGIADYLRQIRDELRERRALRQAAERELHRRLPGDAPNGEVEDELWDDEMPRM